MRYYDGKIHPPSEKEFVVATLSCKCPLTSQHFRFLNPVHGLLPTILPPKYLPAIAKATYAKTEELPELPVQTK